MRLEVLPAKKGDCMLLHCGTEEKPALILIDGGPAGVWSETLLPRLLKLREERGLRHGDPLILDLVVVSHVDDDHINGIVALLQHMKDQKDEGGARDFQVGRLWHNSFDDIVGNDEIRGAGSNRFGTASLAVEEDRLEEEFEEGDPLDAAKVLASVEQGDDLQRLAEALNIDINPEFDGLIEAGASLDADEALGVEIVVAGPLPAELTALQSKFDDWLKRKRKGQAEASVLAALDDKSVANLASIVLLVRDQTGSILLTGDARSDKVIAGLEAAEEIAVGGTLAVSILKMPHHGSIRNIDENFVRRVTADRYVFSGDGKHGNPDRPTINLLLAERRNASMTFSFTYPIEVLDEERQREHAKEQRKRVKKGKPAGADWDTFTDSLAAVLAPPPADVTVAFEG